MHKEFFYEYSQEIKTIFKKDGIKDVYMVFQEQYPAIYVVYTNPEKGSLSAIAIKQELSKLATAHQEVFNGNIIPSADDQLAHKDNAVPFASFCSEGLLDQTIAGNLANIKTLLGAGANINYQEPENNQTALHFGLRRLARLRQSLDETETIEIDQSTIEDMKNMQAIVLYLLEQNINPNLTNWQGKTAVAVFLEALQESTYFTKSARFSVLDKLIDTILITIKHDEKLSLEITTQPSDTITKESSVGSLPQFRGPMFAEKEKTEESQSPKLSPRLAHEFRDALTKTLESFQKQHPCDPSIIYKELYRFAEDLFKEAKKEKEQTSRLSPLNIIQIS